MIGLDSNVVVRYLVQDEPDQSATVSTVIDALAEKAPGFLSLVTVVELYWGLRGVYKISAAGCAELGRVAGCEHTVTFDQRAAQSTAMRLLVLH